VQVRQAKAWTARHRPLAAVAELEGLAVAFEVCVAELDFAIEAAVRHLDRGRAVGEGAALNIYEVDGVRPSEAAQSQQHASASALDLDVTKDHVAIAPHVDGIGRRANAESLHLQTTRTPDRSGVGPSAHSILECHGFSKAHARHRDLGTSIDKRTHRAFYAGAVVQVPWEGLTSGNRIAARSEMEGGMMSWRCDHSL
jgi:hypothetical protein